MNGEELELFPVADQILAKISPDAGRVLHDIWSPDPKCVRSISATDGVVPPTCNWLSSSALMSADELEQTATPATKLRWEMAEWRSRLLGRPIKEVELRMGQDMRPDGSYVIPNPALDDFRSAQRFPLAPWDVHEHLRWPFIRTYGYSVYDNATLDRLARKIGDRQALDIGSGRAYLAMQLQARGVDVIPVDIKPPHETFTPVLKGGIETIGQKRPAVLISSWARPEDKLASQALRAFDGKSLIYVGEGEGGCTADRRFFGMLSRQWRDAEYLQIPRWPDIHDFVGIYTRK